MTLAKTQQALVGQQFGQQASAYLTSAVHAQGPDLSALIDLVTGQDDARVLDLGCGGGHVAFNAAPHVAEVVAYDLSQDMLDLVARTADERGLAGISTRQGFAEALPFADAHFDFVLSRFSAHHWSDIDLALREVARVLKPGGTFALVDTVSPGKPVLDTFLQTVEMLRDCSHVRDYARAEWLAAIARAGLAAGDQRQFRLRLEFSSWIARINTPQVQANAIRALQTSVADEVVRHFEIEPDGTFQIDVALFCASKRT